MKIKKRKIQNSLKQAWQSNMRIGVIGAGSWGSALASALAANGASVSIYGRNYQNTVGIEQHQCNETYLPGIQLAKGICAAKDLDELLRDSDYVLIAVPSHGFKNTLLQIKASKKIRPIIWASKGLVPGSGNFFHDEIIKIFGPSLPHAFIGGPSFAKEVAMNLPTAVLVASSDAVFAEQVRQLFHRDVFRVYVTKDVIGAQIGGIVKNVIAVATGISDGIGFGANARAALITRGIAEMMRFGRIMGANKDTLMGLSGCGDLVLTCTDNQSRNKRFGLALASGMSVAAAQESIGQVVEAVFNAEEICNKAKQYNIDMPISEHVNQIFLGNITVNEVFDSLVSRETKVE
ncbi:MAG: NAD(P)-dependent glycerol-3-phosphate dehydrogenase [Francisellaceae bacterium]|nr:NAD(P)-dependent glycerol-3-phosphate dehydrogenase [Francisellaceae bacterium]MBT6538864.1 NAD(P)-dependent glycerol-3-phosphate dehydrogenase [Francisellaceae bacterium]